MFISTDAHDHPGREDLAKFAYWGTIFVGLPLGFLIICLVLRDAVTGDAGHTNPVQGIIAPSRRAEVFALLLPAAAAVQLSTGYHYRPGFLPMTRARLLASLCADTVTATVPHRTLP